MRVTLLLAGVAILVALPGLSFAAHQRDGDLCRVLRGDGARSGASCTAGGERKPTAALSDCCGTKGGPEPGIALPSGSESPRIDPMLAIASYSRGLAYRRKGDNGHAIEAFSAAIRLDPDYAEAYDARGNAYAGAGDMARAIADYSVAIRLDPGEALTYHNRGLAYAARDEYELAIADYEEAVRLDPTFADAYDARGLAFKAMGAADRAITDYSEAIRLNPKFASAFFDRGRAYLHSGSLAEAEADFKEAIELEPKSAYTFLWLDLAERRAHTASHLALAAKQLDMKVWPAPVIRLFLGRSTPAQTLAAAAKDPKNKQAQICEANFYMGEFALAQSDKDEALRLFRLAASTCPHDFNEWDGANAELKALDGAP